MEGRKLEGEANKSMKSKNDRRREEKEGRI
jgi:hypothetical protein